MNIEGNIEQYKQECEAQVRRLNAYRQLVQESVQQMSEEVVQQLVEERKSQHKTQQDIAAMTGIQSSNVARFETCTSVPTLIVLQKYANALGKTIKIVLCDECDE